MNRREIVSELRRSARGAFNEVDGLAADLIVKLIAEVKAARAAPSPAEIAQATPAGQEPGLPPMPMTPHAHPKLGPLYDRIAMHLYAVKFADMCVAHANTQADHSDAPKPSTEQDWAKLDGAVAFSLIERHAEDWTDAGLMMDAWRRARADHSVPASVWQETDEQGTPLWGDNTFADGHAKGSFDYERPLYAKAPQIDAQSVRDARSVASVVQIQELMLKWINVKSGPQAKAVWDDMEVALHSLVANAPTEKT